MVVPPFWDLCSSSIRACFTLNSANWCRDLVRICIRRTGWSTNHPPRASFARRLSFDLFSRSEFPPCSSNFKLLIANLRTGFPQTQTTLCLECQLGLPGALELYTPRDLSASSALLGPNTATHKKRQNQLPTSRSDEVSILLMIELIFLPKCACHIVQTENSRQPRDRPRPSLGCSTTSRKCMESDLP